MKLYKYTAALLAAVSLAVVSCSPVVVHAAEQDSITPQMYCSAIARVFGEAQLVRNKTDLTALAVALRQGDMSDDADVVIIVRDSIDPSMSAVELTIKVYQRCMASIV